MSRRQLDFRLVAQENGVGWMEIGIHLSLSGKKNLHLGALSFPRICTLKAPMKEELGLGKGLVSLLS